MEACSVEADSDMSEEYRSTLLRLMANQAFFELLAAKSYAGWIARAPGADERLAVAGMVREEIEHWYAVIKLMEALGVSITEAPSYRSSQLTYSITRLFLQRFRWVDVLMSTFLLDRAGSFLLMDYADSSYAPYARAIKRTLADEEDHSKFAQRFIEAQVEKLGRECISRALRKWWPIALNAFGPTINKNEDTYLRLGLKRHTNEERRKMFIAELNPRIEALGLAVPSLYRNRFPFF